jgi:hypothetical protein
LIEITEAVAVFNNGLPVKGFDVVNNILVHLNCCFMLRTHRSIVLAHCS